MEDLRHYLFSYPVIESNDGDGGDDRLRRMHC